jgi:hypothetical protein
MGIFQMRDRFIGLMGVLIFASLAFAQTARPQQSGAVQDQKAAPAAARVLVDGWGRPETEAVTGQKPAPARRHDISGIWEPANGPGEGIQADGAKNMPYDGKPEHDLPYTPLGLQTLKSHKALFGYAAVLQAFNNDPTDKCDPLGFPRADLFQLRHTQIFQNERQVVILYEFDKRWRTIWTDGRELPREIPEPKWYGYSVGTWVDDTTLVVQTVGTMGDERVWLDETGRPVSDAVRVEERFHRVDHDHLELTVTVDDPKMYTKPWVAMNKFPMKLQSPDYDVVEMMCIPSENEKYNKEYGDPASETDSK